MRITEVLNEHLEHLAREMKVCSDNGIARIYADPLLGHGGRQNIQYNGHLDRP